MAFSATYGYIDRNIFDIKIFIVAIRFLIINFILAFISLFLILEEIDWKIFAHRKRIKDKVIDNTSWNINKIF